MQLNSSGEHHTSDGIIVRWLTYADDYQARLASDPNVKGKKTWDADSALRSLRRKLFFQRLRSFFFEEKTPDAAKVPLERIV